MIDIAERTLPASRLPKRRQPTSQSARFCRWVSRWLVYILLGAYGLVSLYPFMSMVSASFKNSNEVVTNQGLIPQSPTFATILDTWNRLDFFHYFTNSLIVTLSVVVGVLVMYSLASYAFAVLRFPGKAGIYRLFLVLLFVPGVTVLLPIILLERNMGIVGTHFGLILPMINGTAPVSILILTSAFTAVPMELREAALMDGAREGRIFRSIYLPSIKPALVTVALLTAIPTWNEYVLTSVSLNDPATFTLPLGLNQLASGSVLHYNNLMAGALIVVIPVIIAFVALQRYFINGIAGAVKG